MMRECNEASGPGCWVTAQERQTQPTNQMTIDIVPIQLEHIESFHRALDIVARERRYLAKLEAPSIEAMRTFVENNLKRGAPQFVAIENGSVIGWCDITPMDGPTRAHRGGVGMGILPDARGQGLGRKLLLASLYAAAPLGLTRIELDVYDDNPRAIRLYEGVGFLREGTKRKAMLIDGTFKNLIMMAIIDFDRWTAPGAQT